MKLEVTWLQGLIEVDNNDELIELTIWSFKGNFYEGTSPFLKLSHKSIITSFCTSLE